MPQRRGGISFANDKRMSKNNANSNSAETHLKKRRKVGIYYGRELRNNDHG